MPACPLCTHENAEPEFSRDGYDFYRCAGCKAVYAHGTLDRLDIHGRYSESYYESDRSSEEGRHGYPSYKEARDTLLEGFGRKAAFVKKFVAGGRLLDLGAAYGYFLNAAADTFAGEGLEVSAYAAEIARREFGAQVEVGDAEAISKPADSFDVVTMWDIIEHLPDPYAALVEVKRVLKPGGYLFISTDDAANWLPRLLGRHWWAYAPPLHICHISKQGLKIACVRAGLEAPLYHSDPRIYTVPEVIKHFGVSYESSLLTRIGTVLESSIMNRARLRLARPEQFIAVVRKPA